MSAATKILTLLPNLRKQEMLVSLVTKVNTVEEILVINQLDGQNLVL